MPKAFVRLLSGLLWLALGVSAVQAHPQLKASDPAADSTILTSPAAIHLTFSLPVIAKFSGIRLVDVTGKEMSVGPAVTDPQDSKQLLFAVSAQLVPGDYSVEWHVVGVDTHRKTGSYKFRVKQ